MNKISKFIELPLKRKLLLIRTWLLMQLVVAGLRILSLSRLMRMLGTNRPNRKTMTGISQEDVLWSVRAWVPLSMRSTCAVQGLAAERLLRNAGFRVAFRVGVQRKNTFRAHAWVEDDSGILIGQTDDELQPLPNLAATDLDPESLNFPL